MWFSPKITLSHNCLFNFITGNRGGGKTFNSLEYGIERYIKTGRRFIYLRRYKEDVKKCKTKLFTKINTIGHFEGRSFHVDGSDLIMTYTNAEGVEVKETIGYIWNLSTAKSDKSIDFSDCDIIVFDEFVIDKSNVRYIPDEVTVFLEFYNTVSRLREDKESVIVLFLSNSLTVTNPYFLYFKQYPNGEEFYKNKATPDILVQNVRNQEYVDAFYETRFGKLIKGTPYGDYAVENKMLLDNYDFVEKRSSKARHMFILNYRNKKYGVWLDYQVGKFWLSKTIDPSCRNIYTLTLKDFTPNTVLIKSVRKSHFVKLFIEGFKEGYVFYEDINLKNIGFEMFKILV